MLKSQICKTSKLFVEDLQQSLKGSRKIVDKLGYPIDKHMIVPVAVLRAYGFDTSSSCQGHMRRGQAAPWIDIGITEVPETPAARKSLVRDNLKAQACMIELLNDFEQSHQVDASTRIILIPYGVFGAFRMTTQAAKVQALLPPSIQRSKLLRFQAEFRALANFLIGRLEQGAKIPRPLRLRSSS